MSIASEEAANLLPGPPVSAWAKSQGLDKTNDRWCTWKHGPGHVVSSDGYHCRAATPQEIVDRQSEYQRLQEQRRLAAEHATRQRQIEEEVRQAEVSAGILTASTNLLTDLRENPRPASELMRMTIENNTNPFISPEEKAQSRKIADLWEQQEAVQAQNPESKVLVRNFSPTELETGVLDPSLVRFQVLTPTGPSFVTGTPPNNINNESYFAPEFASNKTMKEAKLETTPELPGNEHTTTAEVSAEVKPIPKVAASPGSGYVAMSSMPQEAIVSCDQKCVHHYIAGDHVRYGMCMNECQKKAGTAVGGWLPGPVDDAYRVAWGTGQSFMGHRASRSRSPMPTPASQCPPPPLRRC